MSDLQNTSFERCIFLYAVRDEIAQWPNYFEVTTGIRQSCSAVPVPLYSSHRLHYEDVHNTETKWNLVDIVDASGKRGLCQRSGGVIPQPPTDAGEDSEQAPISSRVGLNIHKGTS